MSPSLLAWLLASTISDVRANDAADQEAFERCILAEERLMNALDARELLAVRHEALFDDLSFVDRRAPN